VERRLAGRARFPAAVDPKPLIRILTHYAFDHRSHLLRKASHVLLRIARRRKLQCRFVKNSKKPLLALPHAECRNNRSAAVQCNASNPCGCARRNTKEINEDPFVEQSILVSEDANGFVASQRCQNAAGRFALFDETIPSHASIAVDEPVK